jgi:mRNA-degrading endonuclease toxin of MazEF toxin-antitoxin module
VSVPVSVSPVRQGEVWNYRTGATTVRVVVVSGDTYNQRRHPLAAPLTRARADASLWPHAIALADADNVGGSVDMAELTTVAPAGFTPDPATGGPVTTLIGATTIRVRDAARTILEL